MDYTYYCEKHRDQTTTAPGPSTRTPTGGFRNGPCCPICLEWMFWVPNGGTVVPESGTIRVCYCDDCTKVATCAACDRAFDEELLGGDA